MLACALARVPVTAVFLLVRADMRTTKRRKRLYQLLARGQQRWVCLSDHNRAILAANFGVSARRINVVRNGTHLRSVSDDRREEIRASLDLPRDATVVLTTARLSGQKEHRLIVEALPGLVARDPGIVFAWAGDGPLREALLQSVKATGLERHIRLLGRRDDVPELLAAADLFLMPSRDEGGAPPFALAEAMYAGVPAVVSDAGALTEIIEDKVNGLVFSCGDADDLTAAVGWALSHREQLASMAACAREQAARDFTLERMTDEIMTQIEAGLPTSGGRWAAAATVTPDVQRPPHPCPRRE
jgi:glycosyltransferase involved in cell wall biosynthesis